MVGIFLFFSNFVMNVNQYADILSIEGFGEFQIFRYDVKANLLEFVLKRCDVTIFLSA